MKAGGMRILMRALVVGAAIGYAQSGAAVHAGARLIIGDESPAMDYAPRPAAGPKAQCGPALIERV
jgi:hypothetical protein